MRRLAALAGALLLSGCAGTVDSLAGRSAAGGGLASSHHVQGFACPDFTAQGALQVTGLSASCSHGPGDTGQESFTVQSADPNQALVTAFQAQTVQNAQLMQALGQLLPWLAKAAAAAVGIPIPAPATPPAAAMQ